VRQWVDSEIEASKPTLENLRYPSDLEIFNMIAAWERCNLIKEDPNNAPETNFYYKWWSITEES
jgi:hypothetical protein